MDIAGCVPDEGVRVSDPHRVRERGGAGRSPCGKVIVTACDITSRENHKYSRKKNQKSSGCCDRYTVRRAGSAPRPTPCSATSSMPNPSTKRNAALTCSMDVALYRIRYSRTMRRSGISQIAATATYSNCATHWAANGSRESQNRRCRLAHSTAPSTEDAACIMW